MPKNRGTVNVPWGEKEYGMRRNWVSRGAAVEAESRHRPTFALGQAEAEYRTLEMPDTIEQLPRDEQPSVGSGVDRRFESGMITVFERVCEYHLIHLGAFERQ